MKLMKKLGWSIACCAAITMVACSDDSSPEPVPVAPSQSVSQDTLVTPPVESPETSTTSANVSVDLGLAKRIVANMGAGINLGNVFEAENDGFGIIFETEADTLSDALGKASGRFSEGLRKAFHNETISYMRRTNNERVVIPHPYLSILLTGTPRQLGRLVKDPENGLFSRFLFYRLQSQQESFPERQPLHNGITGQMVDDYMHYLGDMILDFFLRLRDKQADSDNDTSICFALTEEQETAFQRHFNKAAKDYSALFLRLYDSEDRAADAESIMRRLGNICFRMMMILTVSRLITEDVQPIPDTFFCDQRDFDSVLAMEPQLRLHNNLHFDEMLVANGSLPPLDSEYPANGDMLFLDERDFFNQLPSEFIKQEANQLGLKMSLSNSTLKRYLAHLCDIGLVECLKRGSYKNTGRGTFSLLSSKSPSKPLVRLTVSPL